MSAVQELFRENRHIIAETARAKAYAANLEAKQMAERARTEKLNAAMHVAHGHTKKELIRVQLLGLASLIQDTEYPEIPTEEIAPFFRPFNSKPLSALEKLMQTKIRPLRMGGGERIDGVRIPKIPDGASPIIAMDHIKAIRVPLEDPPSPSTTVLLPNFWIGNIVRDPLTKPNYRYINQRYEQVPGTNDTLRQWQHAGLQDDAPRVSAVLIGQETLYNTERVTALHRGLATFATTNGIEAPEALLPLYFPAS